MAMASLQWPESFTPHEQILLSCFGQISLLQLAYYDLPARDFPNDLLQPQGVAILHAIITAGDQGRREVACLRRELATMDPTLLGGTLLGWADSVGLDLHTLFCQVRQAAWQELQAIFGLTLGRLPPPQDPPPPPAGGATDGFWV